MLKRLGQLMGLLIGSCVSPSWMLLENALKNYFDLQRAMQGPAYMLEELERYNAIVLAAPQAVFTDLFPQLIVSLAIGGLFVFACSTIGGLAIPAIVHKMGLKPA